MSRLPRSGMTLPRPWPEADPRTDAGLPSTASLAAPVQRMDGRPQYVRGSICGQGPGSAGPGRAPHAATRRGLLTLLAGGTLAGCGFQPVYMPTASGKAGVAQRELAAVDVPIIPDRPGQLMRQALQDRLANDGGTPHRYDLKVVYWISGEGVGILTDTTATRIRFIGNATWELISRGAPPRSLTRGSARSLDALNVLDSQYFAADIENETIQRRIAYAVADQVVLQLAAYFRRQAKSER